MPTDLELAYAALTGKKNHHDTFWAYYDSRQPLVYNRERLRQIFNELNARFTQNWCAVVVDSVLERIQLNGFTVNNNDPVTDRLNQLWTDTEMSLDADEAHLAALVTGEAYVIAWREEEQPAQCWYNDPRLCHVFYEADNPHVKRFACKWWIGDDDYRHLTLYYADRLEYYRSSSPVKSGDNDVQSARNFERDPDQPEDVENPFGEVPVFHLRRERRKAKSELANAIEPQDAINKLLADMMVAAEFGAFKQRWIISQTDMEGKLKNAPNEIWNFPAGDGETQPTSLGEFSATDLDNYLEAVSQQANAIAIITRTPKHYFFLQGGDPSGEALIALEAPLNKKTQKYIDRFTFTWRRIARFLLKLEGTEIEEGDITPNFDKPETVQPLTQSIIRQNAVNAGIPLINQLRDEGWSEKEIDQLREDQAEQAATANASLASAMVEAQRRFDQGPATNGRVPQEEEA